jgi:hypothetical protein
LEHWKSDPRYWRIAINTVLQKGGVYTKKELTTHRPYILAFDSGQNPVFWVDGKFVVKFYSFTYAGEEDYHREYDTLEILKDFKVDGEPLLLPKMIAHGLLYEKNHPHVAGRKFSSERWIWPFLISSFVNGRPLLELAPKMTRDDFLRVAQYMGKSLKALHKFDISKSTYFDHKDIWDYFDEFVKFQTKHVVKNYGKVKGLNKKILEQIPRYLPSDPLDLLKDIKAKNDLCLLHADLTEENLLGLIQDGKWTPVGMLDFGDVRIGPRVYELVPIHVDMFKLDGSLTMELMKSYGLEHFDQSSFIHHAMCYTILHSQDAFRSIFKLRPEWFNEEDINELAKKIWTLNWPEKPA